MDDMLRQAHQSLESGDIAQAEALCRQVLAVTPEDPGALSLLGILRLQAGRAAEAVPLLREALGRDPNNLGALDALSAALMVMADPLGAEAIVRRALAVRGDLPVAHMRLGMILAEQSRWTEAADSFAEAIRQDPGFAEAHHNLADALMKLGRFAEARSHLERALAIDPRNPDTYNSLGVTLQEFLEWDAAIGHFERALQLNPEFADARYNLGIARLFCQEFEQGWAGYEWRLRCRSERLRLRVDPASVSLYESLPRWQGSEERMAGEVSVWTEQGIGDQILFSTLIPELIRSGTRLRYEVDPRLLNAYRRAFPSVDFVALADPPAEAIRQAGRVLLAGSLPGFFRRSRADFTRQPERLLHALPERVGQYRRRLDELGRGLKVALSWKSSRGDWFVQKKNATLADFAPLLQVSGTRFVDVQYGDTAPERQAVEASTGIRLAHFDDVDFFADLEGVMAVLEACDLVVTTSNATAHLAGALGKRTWLVYPGDNAPFHYWAHGGGHRSLWYPSVEIISARELTDWPSLLRHVAARLERQLHGDAPSAMTTTDNAYSEAKKWSERARSLRWEGRLEEAKQAADRAIEIAPQLPEGWFHLGAVHVELGAALDGLRAYRRALELKPDYAEAWSNLGEVLVAQGDRRGGIEAYRRGVAANPELAPIWSNLGGALLGEGQVAEAEAACRRAVELSPDFAAGWNNLGNVLMEEGQYEAAVSFCERALTLAPNLASAWSNLGSARLELGDLGRALAAQHRALEIDPRDARTHYNLGIAEERRLNYPAAVDCYRRAVSLDSTLAVAHLRLACVQLMTGAFSEGWPEYEWRWSDKAALPKRFHFTSWAGDMTPGRRLLLWGEQGVGDEILHASQVEEIVRAGLSVTLEIDPRLVDLMQRSFAGVRVVPRQEPPAVDPALFDCQLPLASLGRLLRPSFSAFPSRQAYPHAYPRGYLQADPARTASFAARLRAGGRGPVVGLSWGSSNREFGQHKSTRLADWAGVLKVADASFVNLQYGDTVEQRREFQQQHGVALLHFDELDLFRDLDGLAALCAACDLVITVSNVTAHVAGALGVPVWLLAPTGRGGLWYWFHERQDSPWYPSMRIFRQQTPGAWGDVLDRVERELAEAASRWPRGTI